MNLTKIEWCDYTLNPIVGCPYNCVYCYARNQAKRQKQRCEMCYNFEPHPHLNRLNHLSPRQTPKKVFIDSMWDWNSSGIEEEWLLRIIGKMREYPQHTFQILSKRPNGYERFVFPPNVWVGTSITTTADCHRVRDLTNMKNQNIKYVSIEPLHGHIDFWFSKKDIDWLIVGAETGHRKGKIIPQSEWVTSILENERYEGIPIFLKGNLHWPETIREFPEASRK